jgi:hypothetical protein
MGKANVPRVWWIPVYESLFEHQKLLRLKRELKVPRNHAVGMVLCAYLWLANRITEDHMDGDDAVLMMEDADVVLDAQVEYDGFFDAMCKVGWFTWEPEHKRLRVVRYFEKNGAQALKRAREQSKKAHQRRRGDELQTNPDEGRQGDKPTGDELGVITRNTNRDERGHRGDVEGTSGGRQRDTNGTTAGHQGDQHKHEQKQEKNIQPAIQTSRTARLLAGDVMDLVGWLAGFGIDLNVAADLAARYPRWALLAAGEEAQLAEKKGWSGNKAGLLINILKGRSAGGTIVRIKRGDEPTVAKAWARRFLQTNMSLQKAVLADASERRPALRTHDTAFVLRAMPDEAVLALEKVIAERVGNGQMSMRDVSPTFTAFVKQLEGRQ